MFIAKPIFAVLCGDYVIQFGRNQILSRFAGIPGGVINSS